jgi:hypothetical protein
MLFPDGGEGEVRDWLSEAEGWDWDCLPVFFPAEDIDFLNS